jgi:hypothetical protein
LTSIRTHPYLAVYKPDLSISIAFGIVFNENYQINFATLFPDPNAQGSLYDVFFQGELVERYHLIELDGGRVTIPTPTPINNGTAWEMQSDLYEIGKLFNSLKYYIGHSSEHDYLTAFHVASISVV